MPKLTLDTPVQYLKGVGPKMAKRLGKIGIKTIRDLLTYYPFRYKNFTLKSPIAQVQEGETVTIQGKIKEIKNEYTKTGKTIQKALVEDKTGTLPVVWFNQPFLTKTLAPGISVSLAGKIKRFNYQPTLISPEYEILSPRKSSYQYQEIHTGRLVPVYSETKGINSKYLRKIIAQALKETKEIINEIFPRQILVKYNLIPRRQALEKIHFPESKAAAEAARHRLAFEEMFLIQLQALERRLSWQKGKESFWTKLSSPQESLAPFLKSLPFSLTKSQKKAIKEIITDIKKPKPMNRLLQGDVGSGKTIVAAAAAYLTVKNGFQAALMAPTEILAFQHYQTFKTLFSPLNIPVEIISHSLRKETKKAVKITIGTHALLHHEEVFSNLGLLIIDEQHRFGVLQRGKIIQQMAQRQGFFPHLLTMTATPIPRTVTLTLHGDLDLSVIDELPPGRKSVATFVVPNEDREKCYRWLEKEIKEKKIQAFIVCPFVEPSETLETVKAAKEEFKKLQEKIFPNLKLALLHGRMKGKEKKAVLEKLQKGKIDILVSTPVVEVGIDLPNATVMIIEGADRFGLAQLHQLRGRVGRGERKSRCFLFAENPTQKALIRLKALETIHQGVKLAEIDLKLRGPGEIYGLKQHGFPKLKIATFTDFALVSQAREAAKEFINTDPLWQKKITRWKADTPAILPN